MIGDRSGRSMGDVLWIGDGSPDSFPRSLAGLGQRIVSGIKKLAIFLHEHQPRLVGGGGAILGKVLLLFGVQIADIDLVAPEREHDLWALPVGFGF